MLWDRSKQTGKGGRLLHHHIDVDLILHHIADGGGNGRGVITTFMLQLFQRTVFDDVVRYTEHPDIGFVTMSGLELEYGGAKASHDGAILDGEDIAVFREYFMEQLFVQWLGKAHVVMGGVEAVHLQLTD